MCRESKIYSHKLLQTKRICRFHIPWIFYSATFFFLICREKKWTQHTLWNVRSQNFFREQCNKVRVCCLLCCKWGISERKKKQARWYINRFALHWYTHGVKLQKSQSISEKIGKWNTPEIRVKALNLVDVLFSKNIL